ncbi:putative quinol monooxygenase [Geoalkalibacter ferrihydriticus]|nr:putative quinol monooxygenase [Geoalkalibacter ferrihydriticus]
MIEANIRINVPPSKRLDFLQTLQAALEVVRQEPGCLSCNCFTDVEEENAFVFKEVWDTREDLETHMQSVIFNALIGALSQLENKPEIRFNTISSSVGLESFDSERSSTLPGHKELLPSLSSILNGDSPARH